MAVNIPDADYVLEEGAGWFKVKDFAIRIHATDEGVVVDVFSEKEELGSLLASCYAFDSEVEE